MLLGCDQVSLHAYFDCFLYKLFYYQMHVVSSFVHFSSLLYLFFFSFFVVPRTSSLFFIVQFVTVSSFVAFVRVIHLKCSSV